MSKPTPAGRTGGVFIGRYFGIAFYLDASWFLIAVLVTWSFATQYFPVAIRGHELPFYLLLGIVSALLFFLSILLHELGHSLVSQRCGIPVPRITLLFIGGVAEISREPDDAKSELKIALGGPAVSILLSLCFAGVALIGERVGWVGLHLICELLSQMNLMLVLFNMIPGYPLDGGRVLRALIWAKTGRLRHATYITSRIGIGFCWLLVLLGFYQIVGPDHDWHGVVFFLIAFFLKSAAESGYQNAIERELLVGIKVRDVMTANPATILDNTPLNLAVDDYFMTGHHVAYPVCTPDGDFRGLLRFDFLKEVPREKWPFTTAGDLVAEKSAGEFRIGADESAGRAMRLLLNPEQSRLAVVQQEKLVGIVTRHDLLHYIQIHTALEV